MLRKRRPWWRMFLITPHLFLFRKTQSKEFANSLKTKSQYYDLQAPDTRETQNIHKKASEEEELGKGSRPAPPIEEEKIPVSLSYL